MSLLAARSMLALCGACLVLAAMVGCANLSYRKHGPDCQCGCAHASGTDDQQPCPHGVPGGCKHCRLHGHGRQDQPEEGQPEAPFVPPLSRYHPVPTRPVFEPRE